ncbi:MAG: hypothetical protein WAV51_03785 [Microgenomates group bacterium]
MNGNKIVIAILVGALCISAAIYFGGKKNEKVPSVSLPGITESQDTVIQTPAASPSASISPTEASDDLTPIAVAIGKEFGTDPTKYIITKSKQIGDYAIGGVTEKGAQGGAQWWGVMENGIWKYIYSGQSYPSCAVVAPYQIPKSLLDSCMDETTNTLKTL